jgi:prevent-host-death family protein
MRTATLTSREFNQDTSLAKRYADKKPLIITDRGRPSHVLLSFAEYQRRLGPKRSVGEALAMPGVEDIEFEIPRSTELPRPAEF